MSENLKNNISENLEEKETVVVETYKEMSPFQLILRRFFRSKLSIVGLILIICLFLFSFLGPVVYRQWGEETVDRTLTSHLIEMTYNKTLEDGTEITIIEVLEHTSEINSYASPSKTHLLGTDDKGMVEEYH